MIVNKNENHSPNFEFIWISFKQIVDKSILPIFPPMNIENTQNLKNGVDSFVFINIFEAVLHESQSGLDQLNGEGMVLISKIPEFVAE